MIKYFVILLALLVAIPVAGFWRANGENARIANQEIIGDAAPVTIDLRPEVYADLPAAVWRYFDYAFNGQPEVTLRGVRWREEGDFLLPIDEFRAHGGQVSRPDMPVYIWSGTFHRFGLPIIESRDAYLDSGHNMRAKLCPSSNDLEHAA